MKKLFGILFLSTLMNCCLLAYDQGETETGILLDENIQPEKAIQIEELSEQISALREKRARKVGENFERPQAIPMVKELKANLDAQQLDTVLQRLLLTKELLDAELKYYDADKAQCGVVSNSITIGGMLTMMTGLAEVFGGVLQVIQSACYTHHCPPGSEYFAADGCGYCYLKGAAYDCAAYFYSNMRKRECGNYSYLPGCANNAGVGLIGHTDAIKEHSATCAIVVAVIPTVGPLTLLSGALGVIALVDGGFVIYKQFRNKALNKACYEASSCEWDFELDDKIPAGLRDTYQFSKNFVRILNMPDLGDSPSSDVFHNQVQEIKKRTWWETVKAMLGLEWRKSSGNSNDQSADDSEDSEEIDDRQIP